MAGIEFTVKEWFRDARGYRLESAEGLDLLSRARAAATELITLPEAFRMFEGERGESAPSLRIVGNGGALIPYQPSNSLDEILVELLNTPATPEGARHFVNRFGPLTSHGFESDGEHITAVTNTIGWMNIVTDAWLARGGDDAIGQIFGPDGFELCGVHDTRVIYDQPKRTPRLVLTFKHLATLLWARLFDILMGDTAVLRRCAQCNNLFTAGVGTGRRGDAKFCSDEHRALFHSLKRTPAGHADAG
jgi:hypothetical protein